MEHQATSCRRPSAAWLGVLMVSGGACAVIAAASAGRSQPMGPQGVESPQPAAQVSGADEAADQTTAGLVGAVSASRCSLCKGASFRFPAEWVALCHEENGSSLCKAACFCSSAKWVAVCHGENWSSLSKGASFRCSGHEESLFRAAARKKDDRIEVQPGKARLLIVVRSPSGIGAAMVERTRGQWPAQVVVRLYLRGLESFRAETQNAALSLSVLSHGNNDRLMKLSVNDQAQEIKPGTPTAVDVRVFNAEGKPAEGLPPAGGWFEVHLPQVLLSANPAELRLEWIDFYRE